MEIYHEQYVIDDAKERNRGKKTFFLVMYIVSIILVVGAVLFLFLNLLTAETIYPIIYALVSLAIFVFMLIMVRRQRQRIDIDFDYVVTDEKFRIVKVFNRKKRKLLINIDIKIISAMGKVETDGFDRYFATPQIKKIFANLTTDESQLYFIYYVENGEKFIVITEFTDETLTYMRRAIGRDIMVKK